MAITGTKKFNLSVRSLSHERERGRARECEPPRLASSRLASPRLPVSKFPRGCCHRTLTSRYIRVPPRYCHTFSFALIYLSLVAAREPIASVIVTIMKQEPRSEERINRAISIYLTQRVKRKSDQIQEKKGKRYK